MQSVIPSLHASSPAPLSFDRSIELRAFLLRRESGNLLVYSTASLATDAPTVEERRGGRFHAMTDKADSRRRIDAIIDRLRRGDDH
jgi:hypothetical protein